MPSASAGGEAARSFHINESSGVRNVAFFSTMRSKRSLSVVGIALAAMFYVARRRDAMRSQKTGGA